MAMFSDYGDVPPAPAAPSAPLRRKRRFDLSALAPLAGTPMPQGQMVSGHYIAPGPVAALTAGLQRGLGLAGTIQQGRDERADAEAAQEALKQKAAATEADRLWQRSIDVARLDLQRGGLERQEASDAAAQSRFEQGRADAAQARVAQELRQAELDQRREQSDALRERQIEALIQHRAALEESKRTDQGLRRREIAVKEGKGKPQVMRPSAPLRRKPAANVDDLLNKYGE